MYKLAFLYGDTLIYWHAVILSLAVLTGFLFFLASFVRRTGDFPGAAVACPMALVLSLVLARLAHWYFQPDRYESLLDAMTDFYRTGYALMGAFAGCFLTAFLLRRLRAIRSMPAMLDCMSIGGCAAIALGRLACFFTPDDRGQILEKLTGLPFAYPVINATSGVAEPRLAVFLFQSAAAGILLCILLAAFFRSFRKPRRDGYITLIFLLLYCTSQIVLDSMRYDGLHLRSNGFISSIQVVCACGLVLALALISISLIRRVGFRGWIPLMWVLCLGCIGCAAYMEYYVQRHGDQAVLAYSVMSLCMALTAAAGLWMNHQTYRRTVRKEAA